MSILQPIAFLSYVHSDDENDSGYLSELRNRLSAEIQAQTGSKFHIFQDRESIDWGQNWKERIQKIIRQCHLPHSNYYPQFFRESVL